MGRTWIDGTGKNRDCYNGNDSDCYKYRFIAISPQDLPAPELEEATEKINSVLDEVAKNNRDPNRELAIVAVRDAYGEDRLQLAYINVSVSPRPDFDKITISPSDKSRRHIR
jgi:hypothetical protein